MSAQQVPSNQLTPGTRVRYRPSGEVVILDRRKDPAEHTAGIPFHPGWWVRDGRGGLADSVIDAEDGDWEVLRGPHDCSPIAENLCACEHAPCGHAYGQNRASRRGGQSVDQVVRLRRGARR